VWKAADYLRLPSAGPFVVIAAEVEGVDSEALPHIESRLRSMDLYSAWRLLPDLHVGIVHVKTEKQLAKVSELLSRLATTRAVRGFRW
jgi:GGDEF-like domain